MSEVLPAVPVGTGTHPVRLVVVRAGTLASARDFHAALFGWPLADDGEGGAVATPAAGPAVMLRPDADGAQGVVAFIGTRDVAATLDRVVAAGGAQADAPWRTRGWGTCARFRDPAGTLWGLTDAGADTRPAHLPPPMGDVAAPPAGTLSVLECHAADPDATVRFFGDVLGWGVRETMPHYLGFDPGAGIGGTFQTHTPALPAVAYVQVDDVAATLDRLEARGGRRLGDAMAVPGMATFGYFTDPSGTTLGLLAR